MKKCFRCKQEKPFDAFYKHYKRKDGYANMCKECKENWRKEFYQKEKNKQKIKIYGLTYRRKNPEKIKAHNDINYNIIEKKIKRKPCIKCDLIHAEAHHEDYTKPLDVIWLCKIHHEELHRKRRNE